MIAQRLKEAMKNKGINQRRLCELTGISKSGISQYCSGKTHPGTHSLKLIADALDVSIEYLNEGEKKAEAISSTGNVLTVERAAKLMNVGRQFIREGLKRGSLPFGSAVRFPSGKYRYYISAARFTEFTGIEV